MLISRINKMLLNISVNLPFVIFMDNLKELTAISPVDGRYRKTCAPFGDYFSEFALIKYRVLAEVEYFIALTEIPLPQLKDFPKEKIITIRNIASNFSIADAEKIKATEKITNHDVKAVEYFLKEKFTEHSLDKYAEFIHFGLTSQDINNTAVPLSLKKCCNEVFISSIQTLIDKIKTFAHEWKDVPMLAHTHGQPASPTSLGKEFMVFAERLENQLNSLESIPVSAKFGGATGNFNAHHAAYPQIDG